jgi:hypothetical protein
MTVTSLVLWGMAIIDMTLQMGFAASWAIPTDAIIAQ